MRKESWGKVLLEKKHFFVVGGKWSKYKFWLTAQDRNWKFSTAIHAQGRHDPWEAVLPRLTLNGQTRAKHTASSSGHKSGLFLFLNIVPLVFVFRCSYVQCVFWLEANLGKNLFLYWHQNVSFQWNVCCCWTGRDIPNYPEESPG